MIDGGPITHPRNVSWVEDEEEEERADRSLFLLFERSYWSDNRKHKLSIIFIVVVVVVVLVTNFIICVSNPNLISFFLER